MLVCSRLRKGVVFAASGDVKASRAVQGRRRPRETWLVNWGEKVASKGERIYMKQGGEGKVCKDLRGYDTLLTIGITTAVAEAVMRG